MDYKVTINGIPVEAHYSEHAVDEIFVPLLKKLTELQMMKQRRILMLLAAPPGAGKSTLLSFLEKISLEREELMPVQVIGMDGFHRYQEYLLNHFVNRDGRDIPMVKIKGAPVTFDLEKLKARVADVAGGKICGWPVYDRLLHNPVEDAVMIEADISPDGKAKEWPLYDLENKQVMVLDEFDIHPDKESEVKIVDWDRSYFLTKYYML